MSRVLVCDKDCRVREKMEAALHTLGFQELLLCNQRDNALELARDHRPDLAFLEAAPPVNGLDLALLIRNEQPIVAILLLKRQPGKELFKQAANCRIDSFLTTNGPQQEFTCAVELAIHTARLVAELRAELEKTRNALEHRKNIERAKGILMVRDQLTEEQAYRMMRSRSMAARISMEKLAEQILKDESSKG